MALTNGYLAKVNGAAAAGEQPMIDAFAASTVQIQPSEGAFADGDKTKLNNIEAAADVTDAANVNANLPTKVKDIVMVVSFPGAFDTLTAGQDMLEVHKGMIFEWKNAAATLILAEQVLVANDTGASNGTINVEIGGVAALSSALTLSETEAQGTINTSADDVATGDRVEITNVTNGSNADAEDLTVRLVWRLT